MLKYFILNHNILGIKFTQTRKKWEFPSITFYAIAITAIGSIRRDDLKFYSIQCLFHWYFLGQYCGDTLVALGKRLGRLRITRCWQTKHHYESQKPRNMLELKLYIVDKQRILCPSYIFCNPPSSSIVYQRITCDGGCNT